MVRITTAIKGAPVIFHGHDGKDYPARVASVRKGIATIHYYAYVGGLNRRQVTSYVDDPSRIDFFVPTEVAQ